MSALTMDSAVEYESPSKHGRRINFDNDNTSVGKVKKSPRESPTKGSDKSGDKSSTKAPSVVDLCAESDGSTEAIEVQHVVTTRGGTSFLVRNPLRGGRGGRLQNVDVWLRWTAQPLDCT